MISSAPPVAGAPFAPQQARVAFEEQPQQDSHAAPSRPDYVECVAGLRPLASFGARPWFDLEAFAPNPWESLVWIQTPVTSRCSESVTMT